MKTPKNSSKIRKEWIEFIIKQYEKKTNPNLTSVVINDFQCNNATKPGESFNAELVMLDISATLAYEGKDDKEEKTYNFIAKFLSTDPFQREMIIKLGYHIRELTMYANLVDDLNEFQKRKADNKYPLQLPKFIYGKCTSKEYVLIMENAKFTGYNVTCKQDGLTLEQAEEAMKHIARIHALSYAYNIESNILDKYPCFKFNDVISALFKSVVYVSLDNAVSFLKSNDEYKDIVIKCEAGRRKLPTKFHAMWDDLSRHKLLCLCHGDYWLSNLLFSYSDPDKTMVNNLKVIDWQLSTWNNPVMDLHYLINTSTTRALRNTHKTHLLKIYHASFVEITHVLGTDVVDWGYEQFRAEFDRLSLVGFLMGLCLIQGTLSKTGEEMTQHSQSVDGSSIGDKLKSSAAKVIVPIAFSPSLNWIIKVFLKRKLQPVVSELISGKNTVMNERLLSLILEADENGVLDVLYL